MKWFKWLYGLFRQAISIQSSSVQCPWCGAFHWGEHNDIDVVDSGSFFTGEHTVHWSKAIAQCIECGHKYEYEDSSL